MLISCMNFQFISDILLFATKQLCWFKLTVYGTLLAYLAVFTLLDVLATAFGLTVGCIELNPFVNALGVVAWAIFRVGLLAYMLAVFTFGYRFCAAHLSEAVLAARVLKATLFALDIYVGAVVFSGFIAVCARLTL